MPNDTTPVSTISSAPAESAPTSTPATSAVAVEPGIAKPASDADSKAKAESDLDEDLSRVYRNANRPRGEDGKFAPVDPNAPVKPEKPESPEKPKPAEPLLSAEGEEGASKPP